MKFLMQTTQCLSVNDSHETVESIQLAGMCLVDRTDDSYLTKNVYLVETGA